MDVVKPAAIQDYSPKMVIEGVVQLALHRTVDDGGGFTELARLAGGMTVQGFTVRQVNYSEIEPGVIRAFHIHLRQTDVWYVPPSDRLLMVLWDARKDSSTSGMTMRFMLGAGQSKLVMIPSGVAHGAKNLAGAPGRIIYFVDQHFSPERDACDEGRYPWDLLGADVWALTNG